MKKAAFIAGAFLLFLLPATLPAISPIDLMPEDNEIPGWISDTTQCGWEGVADNVDQLYDVIDGPAEQYVPFGFLKGAFKGYIDTLNMVNNDTVETCMEIFDQTTRENALAVFASVGDTGSDYEIIQNLGDTARLDTSFLFSLSLEMVSNNYFIRLSVYRKTAPYKAALLSMAAVIAQNITPVITDYTIPEKNGSFTIRLSKRGVIFSVSGNDVSSNSSAVSNILIYNSKGILVKNLPLTIGNVITKTFVVWDGKNSRGAAVSAGSYVAVLCQSSNSSIKKFILY